MSYEIAGYDDWKTYDEQSEKAEEMEAAFQAEKETADEILLQWGFLSPEIRTEILDLASFEKLEELTTTSYLNDLVDEWAELMTGYFDNDGFLLKEERHFFSGIALAKFSKPAEAKTPIQLHGELLKKMGSMV